MPQKSKDSVHILEGRATLYKRECPSSNGLRQMG